jgi:hypothetical protein
MTIRCGFSRLAVPVLAGALVATLVAPAGAAGPTASPARRAPAVTEAQNEAAALAAAQSSGGRVEVMSARTEWSQVFATPSGALVLEQYLQPQRTRRADGAWTAVDTRLRVGADGSVAPGATVLGMIFSGGGAGPLARLRNAGHELSVSWPGTLPPPVLEGSSATYREVLPGVDLRVTASALGFSEVLVVKTPAAAANPALSQVRFGLTTSEGLSVTTVAGGGAEVRDGGGEAVFAAPAALMWDSSGAPAAPERTALMPMAVTGGQLTVVPDKAMLSDPGTKYPVFIDPSWSGGKYNNEWTTVWSKYPDSSFWRNTSALLNSSTYGAFGVGRVKDCDTCTTYRIRTLFRMDARGVRGKQIRNAKLRMQQRWSWTCSPASGARVWRMGSLINSSTTWNNQPAWGTASGVVAANHKAGAAHGCLNVGDVEFDVTGIVAATSPSGNTVVFGMRAVDEDTVNHWKRYWHDSPRLVVEYNTVPTTPVAADLAERAESTSPDLPCASGASRPLVRSALPWLRARLRDPDGVNGGRLKGTFLWQQWNGSAWVAMTGSPKASALVAPEEVATVQITSGLVDGGRYRWQVQTADTLGGSSQWSPWCEFQVESAPPGARPGVVSGDGLYPESPGNTLRRGGVGKSGRFALSAGGVPDVVDYVYKRTDPSGWPPRRRRAGR